MNENAPATKKDLADAIAAAIAANKKDLAAVVAAIEANKRALDAATAANKNDLTQAVDRMTELIRDVETSLLTSFHGYGKGQAARMHALEVSDSTTAVRLAALEERVLNLETRRGGTH